MFRSVRMLLASMLLVGATVATGVTPVVALGCDINVTYTNNSNKTATIDLIKSKVRVRLTTFPVTTYGPWARIDPNDSTYKVGAGKTKHQVYHLDLGCNKNRQYKFYVNNGHYDKVIYKPSASGVTKSVNLTVTIPA